MAIPINKYLEAIEKNAGLVSGVARDLKVSVQAVYQRKEKNKKIKDAFESAIEENLDLAESKLVEAIGSREAWAICFYLKCKGKGRGYIETQKHEIETPKEGITIHVKVDGAD